jgi:lipoyl(octanoyl) transferase
LRKIWALKPKVIYQDLKHISYAEAWDYQFLLQRALIDGKIAARKTSEAGNMVSDFIQKHYLVFCEHNPVYTLGKSGSVDNLLLDEKGLNTEGVEFFKINRGGDITYHGPGQITGYPIFDLDYFFNDVHKYVRSLEEVIIRTLAEYGLEGMRIKEYTGVWFEGVGDKPKRKICAIGVHLSRWVTMHGFAFNVNTDLKYFKNIIPCGIVDEDKTVTTLALELERPVDVEEVKSKLKKHFAEVFGFEFE